MFVQTDCVFRHSPSCSNERWCGMSRSWHAVPMAFAFDVQTRGAALAVAPCDQLIIAARFARNDLDVAIVHVADLEKRSSNRCAPLLGPCSSSSLARCGSAAPPTTPAPAGSRRARAPLRPRRCSLPLGSRGPRRASTTCLPGPAIGSVQGLIVQAIEVNPVPEHNT